MDLDSVFDFLKNHKIATSTISSIGALITFITRYPEPSKKILLIVLRLLLKYMPKDIDMTEQSIKSCYGGKNNWVSRVLSCLGYFAKFLIPLVCVSYFIFPSWLFVGVLLLIVVLLVLGLSLVIVASRIEVEKVTENRQSQEEKQKKDMEYIANIREDIYQSMFWTNNYGRAVYICDNDNIKSYICSTMDDGNKNRFIGSNLGKDGFDNCINAIELILKDYGVQEMPLPIDFPEFMVYLNSITAISGFITMDRLEEAKKVRILWNANHMPSQTGK